MALKRKGGLGKGLGALIDGGVAIGKASSETTGQALDGKLAELPVEFMQRGKYQPRRDMHPEALEELAESIKAQGVMQPIVVRLLVMLLALNNVMKLSLVSAAGAPLSWRVWIKFRR